MDYRIGESFVPKRLYLDTTFPISSNSCSLSFFIRSRTKQFSTKSTDEHFLGRNAYDVLGIPETSTFAEIKASFRKLAKETHPDVARSDGDDASASRQFVQILAAYEILSDSERRAHYDQYLFTKRKIVPKQPRQGSTLYRYESHVTKTEQMEVVEWLKWYRFAINDILSQKRVVVGSGYFDILEDEFYSAIHAAYYGPLIESMDLLPDCFEAEERSAYQTPEVLHLVSGRDLFGIVNVVDKIPEISHVCSEKINPFISIVSEMSQHVQPVSITTKSRDLENDEVEHMEIRNCRDHASDVYKDLELHISGELVAVATRIPPKSFASGTQNQDSQDHIHVFLNSNVDEMCVRKTSSSISSSSSSVGSRILLGTISGLGTNSEDGSCFVYNNSGTKTHAIMKHRTLMVKHMHWYQVGDEVSACECRCSRARLPPSKFWLFEPRCCMHDIGGWYVETFGREKKGKTVPSQREWGVFSSMEPEKRLHPAMYLLALAYRTLDIEDAKRSKRTFRNILEPKLFSVLHWCKKLV
ncbi:uncharacterized protein LOC131219010 isoform X2 [Magnolia sinica]|uniref:uncharacterized protein LOC131219010 isoform X2 n=1 Tax=Magnolia sinica TaxID=86752 RepID=UPI002659179C|nr:uncharacterized protein LOC131219010 isoform X2 [Magnolia sinica]